MEDVYTIKVKTKPDTRNLYPSERRYSASTVSGLAWVHIALAATSFLLACLALVNPNTEHIGRLNLNDTQQKTVDKAELLHNLTVATPEEIFDENATIIPQEDVNSSYGERNSHMLVIAPGLLTIFALGAGFASIMASFRWYIDRNITWLFVMSILSTICSFVAFVIIAAWFANTSKGDELSDFYKDKIPFKDFIVVSKEDVVDKNQSHIVITNYKENDNEDSHLFTKRVLSINILIAAFLEFLWSILSVKISYKGMRSNYKDDTERRGNCVSVVTKIKGNNAKRYPNGKLLSPKPDLIEHYPNRKIKKIFLANGDNGFYLKNQNPNDKKENTETNSEFYRDRMMNYLNRCASLEGVSNPDVSPSVHSEVLNTIPEVVNVELNETPEIKDRMTPVSWGDTPEHTVFNQNNIPFDALFKFSEKKEDEKKENGNEISEISN